MPYPTFNGAVRSVRDFGGNLPGTGTIRIESTVRRGVAKLSSHRDPAR
jgi:hypothetical protein